jgi:ornithine cyclodeaminase
VAIIGTGEQAATQLEAVALVRDIQRVSIWSRTHEHALQFAKNIQNQFDTHVMTDIHHALCDADIICTATASSEPLILPHSLKSDVHINAIGSHSKTMQEIAPDVFKQAITVVDQLEAALSEAGEVIAALEANCLNQSSILELGSLLNEQHHSLKQQLTVFKSVGLAIQDISIAEKVYHNALQQQLGYCFDLT